MATGFVLPIFDTDLGNIIEALHQISQRRSHSINPIWAIVEARNQ